MLLRVERWLSSLRDVQAQIPLFILLFLYVLLGKPGVALPRVSDKCDDRTSVALSLGGRREHFSIWKNLCSFVNHFLFSQPSCWRGMPSYQFSLGERGSSPLCKWSSLSPGLLHSFAATEQEGGADRNSLFSVPFFPNSSFASEENGKQWFLSSKVALETDSH